MATTVRSQPYIVTVPSGYDRRATPDLLTLQLITPAAFHQQGSNHFPGYHWPDSEVYVVNTHFGTPKCCYRVRCNGKPVTFKRRPELRFPWAYGFFRTRSAAYGHFISLDGETWDTTNYQYAPYRVLSILTAKDRRYLARAEKGAK